jgi:hypothetical protein
MKIRPVAGQKRLAHNEGNRRASDGAEPAVADSLYVS